MTPPATSDHARFQGDPTRYEIWLMPHPKGWTLELHVNGSPCWVYCSDLGIHREPDDATPYIFANRAAARTFAYQLAACNGWGTCTWRKL